MSQPLKQLLPGFLWLIILLALAMALVLILSRAAGQRTAQNPESSPTTEPVTAEIPTETPTTLAATEPATATVEATTETPSPETATPAVITITETTTPTIETTPPATTTIEPTSPPTETPTVSSTSPIPTSSETPLLTPTLTLTPTDTPTLTPTLQVTPTPIPGDTIPIDAAPVGEAILYTTYPQSAEGVWEGSLRFAPIDNNAVPVKSFSVTFPIDFNPMLDPVAAISPDGRYVLLLKPNFPGGEPYIFDRETNEVKPIFDDYPWGGGFGFDWSPDSKNFVFWALDVGLWMINVDTTKEILLTIPDGPVQRASISPSGQQVSFIGPPLKNDKIFAESLWVVEASGGKPSWILDVSGSRNPGWSTEGILYFKGEGGTKKGQPSDTGILWATNVEGNQQRNFDISIARGLGFESHLSPDRTQLAFTGYTPDETFDCDGAEDRTTCIAPFLDIYILDLTSGQTINLGKGIQPTWSPDGKSLAFISYRTGTPEVWLTKTDKSELRQLTNDGLFKQIAWWLKARG